MQPTLIKATAAALWISALSAVGLVGGVGSLSGWLLLATVAIVPPLVLMSRLSPPDQTTSESIREVLK